MASLEIITGSMFSGKSEEMVKRLQRPGYKKRRILVVKPTEDTRKSRETFQMISDDKYVSSYKSLRTQAVGTYEELMDIVEEHKPAIIAIDEAQFFGLWLVDAIKYLLDANENDDNFTIIVVGLYKDFLRNPFGPIPELILREEPDNITIKRAVCHKCEERPALSSYKIDGSPNLQKDPGDKEKYQARCRICQKLPN